LRAEIEAQKEIFYLQHPEIQQRKCERRVSASLYHDGRNNQS